MQPNLTELELLAKYGEFYRRNRSSTYLKLVMVEIRRAMAMDPDWRAPDVRVVDKKLGNWLSGFLMV